jgi:hypothetical protein
MSPLAQTRTFSSAKTKRRTATGRWKRTNRWGFKKRAMMKRTRKIMRKMRGVKGFKWHW